MTKQKYIPPSLNTQKLKARIDESFLYSIRMILDESETMMEAKERIMFQIMQDMVLEAGDFASAKAYVIDPMIKKLKTLSN